MNVTELGLAELTDAIIPFGVEAVHEGVVAKDGSAKFIVVARSEVDRVGRLTIPAVLVPTRVAGRLCGTTIVKLPFPLLTPTVLLVLVREGAI